MKQTLHDFAKTHEASESEGLSVVLDAVAEVALQIQGKLMRNGLIEERGDTGEHNVYGEEVQKLDAYANQVLTDRLLSCDTVHAVGSEELAEPKFASHDTGKFIITHDPVDGSSNLDINLPVGTIFGVYPKHDTVLQKGNTLIASGYVLYGPSMMLIYATKGSVQGFTYDPDANAFVLTFPDITIGEKKIYSLNEGNWSIFNEPEKKFLESIKSTGEYSLRYVGSMVGDMHRTLIKGGVFLYPSDTKHEHGKLRLLYEVAPFTFLIKQAGGDAASGTSDPLEILPEKHDQRVPIVIGTKEIVDLYRSCV